MPKAGSQGVHHQNGSSTLGLDSPKPPRNTAAGWQTTASNRLKVPEHNKASAAKAAQTTNQAARNLAYQPHKTPAPHLCPLQHITEGICQMSTAGSPADQLQVSH